MSGFRRVIARPRSQKHILGFLPPQTRVALAGVAVLMLAMTLLRLTFLLVNRGLFSRFGVRDLAGAFAIGTRFDLHTVLILAAPFFLILHLPGLWKERAALRKPLMWIPALLFAVGSFLIGIDIHYYADAGRHLSYEVGATVGNATDLAAMTKTVLTFRWTAIAWLVFVSVFLWGWARSLGWAWRGGRRAGRIAEVFWMALFLLAAALGVRGTLEAKPLRTTHAFSQGRVELGHLALNAIYTVGNTLARGNVTLPRFFDDGEAVRRVRGLLGQEGVRFVSPDYPVLRDQDPPPGASPPRNIVLLVMESWSGVFVGAMGGSPSFTPRFDALSADGLLFTRFTAPGRRSVEAMTSICLGLPPYGDLDVNAGALGQNVFIGLAKALGDRGYSSVFVHGGKVGTLGLNGFAKVAGFDRYLGMEDMEGGPKDYDGAWGLYDHAALDHFLVELRGLRAPFLALWFSLSSHEPFRLPEGYPRPKGARDYGTDFVDSIAYSDSALGDFFDRVRKEPFFANTVFVVVGDHTAGRLMKTLRQRHVVPCLVYAPGLVAPGRVDEPSGQMDLLPTILDLAGTGGRHHAFGVSALRARQAYGFASFQGGCGWFRGKDLVTVDTEGNNPALADGSGKPDPEAVAELRSFLQVSKRLIKDNRLAPARD